MYELAVNDSWSLVESGNVEGDGTGCWIEVYGYNEALTPEASTTVLADTLTMVDMTLPEFAQIIDVDVPITGYGCKTVDEDGASIEIDAAWSSINDAAGV